MPSIIACTLNIDIFVTPTSMGLTIENCGVVFTFRVYEYVENKQGGHIHNNFIIILTCSKLERFLWQPIPGQGAYSENFIFFVT